MTVSRDPQRVALQFVLLMGLVSLFADVTYEGARSATGPYLGLLGASAAVVGLVSGAGELVGLALRLFTGVIADRTRRYWLLTYLGYAINLLAVPLLALAGSWQVAAFLVILERLGKAIRAPSRDVLLADAAATLGPGRAFGLHEALDQVGAVSGPQIVAAVLFRGGSYRQGFALLLVPALLSLSVLAFACVRSRPLDVARQVPARAVVTPSTPYMRTYILAVALIAFGYADYPLIAYHLARIELFDPGTITALYALAMAVDAVAALFFGRLFDRLGLPVLAAAALATLPFAPLVFLGGKAAAIAGIVCWGIGLGAQESVFRAAIASLVPRHQRGSFFGLFNAGYGLSWFAGSALLGTLHQISLPALVTSSMIAQGLAVLLLVFLVSRPRATP